MLSKVSIAVGLALTAAVVNLPAVAQDVADFTVGDIKVEGLQRVSEGTVYNYLPVNIGDRLTPQRIREAVRALYQTGFFRDVEVRRDGDTLLVLVRERPTIESFELKGNKDIKTEDLSKSLRNVGLAQGKTFDRSVLEEVTAFLQDQYGSRGKYAARVKTEVEELADNRVKVKIDIVEGKRAKIRQVNIVGNEIFTDKQVRDEFELKTPNWLSWYRQDDRYSRESLQGDLEKLRSFYMDRGYANFQVESVQVAIAPTKDDIFITVNIDEGEVFKVKDVKLAGNFVIPEEELRRYLLVGPGTTYSRKVITATQELLQNRLGEDGYAFAKVDPVATAAGDKDSNELSINFVIEPGNRVYVRHIAFEGANKINDEVLRREMRQMEGAWLSNLSLERSKQRLQRLPYIKKVESETKPVPGIPDMVDVVYNVEEGPSAQLGGGIGYSESQSFILNGNYADSNFMGTGRRIAVDLNSGRYSKVYGLSVTEPYFTKDGIALTGSLTYRDVTQFVSASSDFSSETIAGGFDIGYPISEFQGVRFGLSYQRADLLTSSGSAQQAIDWVRSNGSPRETVLEPILDDNGIPIPGTGPFTFYGTRFNTVDLTAGWSFDSRNRALFATRGTRHTLSLSYTLPGISDVQYFVANYEFLKYVPLFGRFALSLGGEVGYGMDVGKTTALPPFRQFFAGGPDTVRGYRESRLGPKDQFGNPYGGNLKVVGRAELILPMPQKWASSARLSWFYDIGNIFSVGDRVNFTGRFDPLTGQPGAPIEYGFKYDKLKHSTGLAVQWLAPLGIFRFSYAVPLNAYAGDSLLYEDEQERFQFSIGQAF
ncbi:MAG TPA: outer membrane protein assembly factor BamA [Steroidobacteraceae bacterium]|nr:outer membrane protein assembly factor BamA [Steroidobacteraceae bacterium]HRX89161.1 outer membrane protein assembly factor BamA [Steroidobacteraceae bacterium]